MRIIYSHKCLEYRQEGHPESPARIRRTHNILKDSFDFTEAKPCSDNDLLLVHSKELANKVRQGKLSDNDTPALPSIFEFAKLSAGAAIQAAGIALKDEKAFSLMRPPGHHAGRNFLGGFCYFNSIAMAVENALKSTDKIAILDIDGHHGNGTQDIFFGREDVLFVSLHQKNAFPNSGHVSEKNCINFPLPAGTKTKEYMKSLVSAIGIIEDFKPDLLAVSSGFDTYALDPLLQLELDLDAYFLIGDAIRQMQLPCFAVLEGGYSENLPKCVYNFLKGIRD